LVKEGLEPLLREVLEKAGDRPPPVSRIEIAGNPTMLQTLTGDSLAGLSRYPFVTAWQGGRQLEASSIGLEVPTLSGDLHLLPALGPFVGADIVAGVLASGMLEDDRTTLLMDFGTNGELLLWHEGKCLATATAAGPAFEGGRLRCGTTARAEAVSAIELSSETSWRLLGGKGNVLRQPHGISGAAYVDFLALAVGTGLINAFGRFQLSHPLWQTGGKEIEGEAVLFFEPHTSISEADIAELMQAKAAIGAGVQVLLDLFEIGPEDLDRVLVAGGFGYHLHPDQARVVGLLPMVPNDRLEIIGNSSLAGASLALQYDLGHKMIGLSKISQTIELNQIPSFADYYTDCLTLEPLE
jgi:uncharacterized 2Fe-2S/4Fe-4S cluster protein (DUF4445 family)